MAEADALVDQLAAGPTRSYAASKRALNRMLYPDLDGQLDLEAELQHELARTKDFQEGVARLRREARARLHRAPRRARVTDGTKWSRRAGRGYDPARLAQAAVTSPCWQRSRRRCSPARLAPGALADAFTPESGGSPNAEDIDTLYKITLYIGIVIFLGGRGHADLLAGQVPRPPRRTEAAADPRQHAARDRLDRSAPR